MVVMATSQLAKAILHDAQVQPTPSADAGNTKTVNGVSFPSPAVQQHKPMGAEHALRCRILHPCAVLCKAKHKEASQKLSHMHVQ